VIRSLRTSGTWPMVKKAGGAGTGGTVWDPTPPRSAPGENRTSNEGVVAAMGVATLSAADRMGTPSTGGTGPEANQRQLGACELRHADQHQREDDAMQVAAYRKDETDHPFSVAAVLDRALVATEQSVTALSRHAQVSVTMARQWLDETTGKAPNLRHVARLPARLRHALLWPLLDDADPAPSVAWCLGELARCMADLSGCVGDATAGATVDRIGAELVWIGTRMRAMGGGK
jgi:hypothetical protein